MTQKALTVAQRHWFYLVLPFLLVTALTFRTSYPWQLDPKLGEAVDNFRLVRVRAADLRGVLSEHASPRSRASDIGGGLRLDMDRGKDRA